MMRRVTFALFIVFVVVSSAWPKFKEDEQKYLDDKFNTILDQVQTLTTQVQTLNAQLQALRQNQAQFQAFMDRQQQSLQDLNQMVTSMRLGSEENLSNVKTAILQLRKATEAEFAKLSGVSPTSATAAGGTGAAQAPAQAAASAYITGFKGDDVLIDMGSGQGIHQGSRLTLYKASDPNTQVGVIEVTQVIDAGNSRAQIVALNPGVKPEWGDVARLQ